MWLRIIDINLDVPRICVVVAPGETDDFLMRLDTFVGRCVVEGVRNIHVFYRRDTSARNIQRLEDFASLKRLPKPVPESAAPALTASVDNRWNTKGLRFSCGPVDDLFIGDKKNRTDTDDRAFYKITVHGLDRAVESINKAIGMIGTSVDLDPRSSLQLRLCIYELSMNTAEHGDFPVTAASIDVTTEFGDDRVWVVYRDDSKLFRTVSTTDSKLVGEKISARCKRGLGLYMINRLCSDFVYERDENWNVSSFSLDINRNHLATKKG